MSTARTPSPPLLLGALLVGLGAGWVAASLLTSRPAPPGRTPERSQESAAPANDALAPALRDLTDVLAALREDLALREAAPPPSTAAQPARESLAPAGARSLGTGAELDGLTAAVRELARAVSESSSTTSTNRALEIAPRDRFAAFSAYHLPRGGLEDAANEAHQDRFRRDHLLWTPERLIETYGRPDDIWPTSKGLAQWHYEIDLGEGWTGTFDFWLDDDRVYLTDSDVSAPDD